MMMSYSIIFWYYSAMALKSTNSSFLRLASNPMDSCLMSCPCERKHSRISPKFITGKNEVNRYHKFFFFPWKH